MRKIIVTEFITLDGIMEDPHLWSFPYWTDEIGKFKHDELAASDAQLLGRVTFDAFAEVWPSQADEYAKRLNSLPKYAVSRTLKNTSWNNSEIINGNLAEAVNNLKQQPGENILIHGSLSLVSSLLELKLIDQINLLVFPIILGKGKKLFDDMETVKLKLVETKSYASGVILQSYEAVYN